jgi:hypothetical protein
MFNVPTHTVYFLGGMANFTVDPTGIVSWTYENLFTHERIAASFDNRTHQLGLENAEWHCNYEGPGP